MFGLKKAPRLGTQTVDALMQGVSSINGLMGYAGFVTQHIVLPDEKHFPDPIHPTGEGIDLIVARLLQYAGVSEQAFEVEFFVPEFFVPETESPLDGLSDATAKKEWGEPASAEWHEEGAYWRVSISETLLENADRFIGALALVASWICAVEHGVVRGEDFDQDLTGRDTLACMLGFGALLANASLLHDSGMQDAFTSSFSKSTLGHIAPELFPWLLGLQLAVREQPAQQKAVLRALTPNPRAALKMALKTFAKTPALLEKLGLPTRAAWPAAVPLEQLTAPFELDDDDDDLDGARGNDG